MLVGIFQLDDLEKAMITIFSDTEFLQNYSMEDSYMWKNRKQILCAIQELKSRKGRLYYKCSILDTFAEWSEQRKTNHQVQKAE